MKKNNLLILMMLLSVLGLTAQTPKHELRGSWLATVWNIDWPTTKGSSAADATSQKTELSTLLDQLEEGNMYAAFFQIRSNSDAVYLNGLEPTSSSLTGVRGASLTYDPLTFAVTEAHKRGMELHAWINPYRLGSSSISGVGSLTNANVLHAGTSTAILNPADPAVRAHLVAVIEDVITRYDVDGVVFDDYFYNGVTAGVLEPEEQTFYSANNPHNLGVDEWRREQVNELMRLVHDMIAASDKPWVRFGQAPFGIWSTSGHYVYNEDRTQSDFIAAASGISGSDYYGTKFCDAATWLKRGYIDYISPQLYWPIGGGQDYRTLCTWWSDLANRYNRPLIASQDVADNGDGKRHNSPEEITNQIDINRAKRADGGAYSQGSVFYNTNHFLNSKNENDHFANFKGYHNSPDQFNAFAQRALPPTMTWKSGNDLPAPTDLAINAQTLSWKYKNSTEQNVEARFAIYCYPKDTDKATALAGSEYLLGMSYGTSFALGASYDATKTYTVVTLDRYGKLHESASMNEGSTTTPPTTDELVVLTPVWSKTQAASGYLLSSIENRSMSYYDGRLYIPNKTAGTFTVVNATSGAKETSKTMTASAFWMHCLRVTDDGVMLLGNTNVGSNALVLMKSDITSGGIADVGTVDISGFGRFDFFGTMGEFSSSQGGFLVALSNVNHKALYLPFADGQLEAEDVLTHADLPIGTSAIAIPADVTSFYASTASEIPTKHSLYTGELIDAFGTNKPATSQVSGLSTFTLSGREYMVTTVNAFGSVEVFDITQGLAKAVRVSEPTPSLGSTTNQAYTVAICSHVEGQVATIYVMAPGNGIAAYEFEEPSTSTDVDEALASDVLVCNTPTGITVNFEGKRNVALYHVSGQCLYSAMTEGTYSVALTPGVYVLRVDGESFKIVR